MGLWSFGAVCLLLSLLSLRSIGFSLSEIVRGFRNSGYLSRALPPSFERADESLRQLWRTFLMAVAGTSLAAVLSIPVGICAARPTSPSKLVRLAARTLIVATRAIPDLIFAVFFVIALSIGELPGVLAMGLHSIGMLGKLLADAIEEIDEGPLEAARAGGASRTQEIANAVVPQVLPRYLSGVLFRLDINMRISVVLGFAGAGGIGFLLQSNLRNPLRYPVGIGQALMVLALILIVDQIAAWIRRLLDGFMDVAVVPTSTSRAETPGPSRALRVPWTASRAVLTGSAMFGLAGSIGASYAVGLNPWSFVRAIWRSAKAVPFFFPPDFTTHRDAIVTGLKETLALALAATFIGLTAAVPYALLVARSTTPNRFVAWVARLVQVVLRSIPELVVVLLFVSAVGLGPLPGAAALSIATFGFTGRLIADALDDLPPGPQEGVRSTGAYRSQEIASAVMPQAVPALTAIGLYAFDVNVRSSSILGLVGAGGIGRILDETRGMLQYETVGAVVTVLFVIVLLVEVVSNWVRRYLI